MQLGFAWLELRDGTPLYVNPWAVQSLTPADAEGRTLIVFTNGDREIVDGDVQNVVVMLEKACSED